MSPDNALTLADAAELVAFVAGGLNVFRDEVLKHDPDYFKYEENLSVYRDLGTNLITVWVQNRVVLTSLLAKMEPGVTQ